MMTPNYDLEAQVAAELRAAQARGEAIALVIQPADALLLLAHVQQALRHPANTGAPAIRARELGERLALLLGQVTGPAVQDVARRGWDAAYDVSADTAHVSAADDSETVRIHRAVDAFAAVMKAKLLAKMQDGFHGGFDPENAAAVWQLLATHVARGAGQEIDVANLALMLWWPTHQSTTEQHTAALTTIAQVVARAAALAKRSDDDTDEARAALLREIEALDKQTGPALAVGKYLDFTYGDGSLCVYIIDQIESQRVHCVHIPDADGSTAEAVDDQGFCLRSVAERRIQQRQCSGWSLVEE